MKIKNKLKKIDWKKLLVAILICQFAGILGSFFTSSAIPNWYQTIQKPDFTPPGWLFGPVWVTLYTLMGVAVYLICQKKALFKKKLKKNALMFFGIQLVLNALWSIVFFGLNSISGAFIIIILLWLFILLSIIWFFKLSKSAGILLLPYILWVSFATVLNLAILLLN